MILAPVVDRPQGRAPRPVREPAGAGLRPRPRAHRRQGRGRHRRRTASAAGGRQAVGGQIHELDDPPALNKLQKHSIDVVVDRLKVTPAHQAAAGRIVRDGAAAGRRPRARAADGRRAATRRRRMAPSTSSPASSPARSATGRCANWSRGCSRSTIPLGACPECDGLGVVQFFDPARIVQFPNLSLGSGAVRGWDRRNQFYFQMLQSLSLHYGFDIEQAVRGAARGDPRHHPVRLGQRTRSRSSTSAAPARRSPSSTPSKASCPNFERRYKETDSAHIREELPST